jgi:DNA invertase Pin-like site-specific DNA recombinase
MQPKQRAHRACVAFGYQCVWEPARLDDPEPSRDAVAIEEFCRRRRWHLAALQRDVGRRHGKWPQQPALMHTIERLHDGEASCIVVAQLRDLCPSVAELGGILDAVERAGARLVSLDPPFDTGTPVGRAVGRMLTTVSGWERTRRAEMTAAARSKSGIAQEVPTRLRRRIVGMRRAGLTLQAIADRLNEDGVPTVRGGALWRPSSVQATLGYKRPGLWEDAEPNT